MIHKVNDKFAIVMEKTTYRKREGSVRVCITHPNSTAVKKSSIAYLKALKEFTSEGLVSNIKVNQNSPSFTEITYEVSDVFKVNLFEEEFHVEGLTNLISI
jgi:hypothetical protein